MKKIRLKVDGGGISCYNVREFLLPKVDIL